MSTKKIVFIGIVAFLLLLGGTRAGAVSTGLELLIMVDVSGSIDANEFNLQRTGYVNAFQSAALKNAILNNPTGSIAASLAYWSSANQQQQAVGWTLINSAAASDAFAAAIAAAARPFNDLTSISGAINFGTPLFTNNGFEGQRLVEDISGDGVNNDNPPGVTLASARAAALAAGITINGLVIGNGPLLAHYQNFVIGGPGAFVDQVNNFADFGDAVRSKLTREVRGVPEPATFILLGSGLLGLFGFRRKNK